MNKKNDYSPRYSKTKIVKSYRIQRKITHRTFLDKPLKSCAVFERFFFR